MTLDEKLAILSACLMALAVILPLYWRADAMTLAETLTLDWLVRAMCHIKPGRCECADKGQYQDYSACRLVYRHAHSIRAQATADGEKEGNPNG